LKKLIEERMNRFKRKRARNKIGAVVVQSLQVIFSTLTTVLIGWNLKDLDTKAITVASVTNMALLTSALAASLGVLDKFFDFKALWISYNISLSRLRTVHAKTEYYEALGASNIAQQQLHDLFMEFEGVCTGMDQKYEDIRSEKD
jgi:hypothetical protein